MAITYRAFNIPNSAIADVDIVGLTRNTLKAVGPVDKTTTKTGAKVFSQDYVVEAGDKDLPTSVNVVVVRRPITAAVPCGTSLYAITLTTTVQLLDDDSEVVQSGDAEFKISWSLPGQSMIDETEILKALQSVFSLIPGTIQSGAMDEVNLAHLAYGNPDLF